MQQKSETASLWSSLVSGLAVFFGVLCLIDVVYDLATRADPAGVGNTWLTLFNGIGFLYGGIYHRARLMRPDRS